MEERKKTVMEVTEEEILFGDGSGSKVSSEEEGETLVNLSNNDGWVSNHISYGKFLVMGSFGLLLYIF